MYKKLMTMTMSFALSVFNMTASEELKPQKNLTEVIGSKHLARVVVASRNIVQERDNEKDKDEILNIATIGINCFGQLAKSGIDAQRELDIARKNIERLEHCISCGKQWQLEQDEVIVRLQKEIFALKNPGKDK